MIKCNDETEESSVAKHKNLKSLKASQSHPSGDSRVNPAIGHCLEELHWGASVGPQHLSIHWYPGAAELEAAVYGKGIGSPSGTMNICPLAQRKES